MSELNLRREGEIAIIELNRPDKRNALSIKLIHELRGCFSQLCDGQGVRAIILTGAGSVFCSGMDLDELRTSLSASPQEIESAALNLSRLFHEIATHPLPTIAALNGSALAGGAGLMTVCDLALSVPEAKFGYPEVRRGLIAAMVLPHLLRHVGERMARYLLLTGELIDADAALACGLLNRVVPTESLLPTALEWAEAIRQGGPQALRGTKELFTRLQTTSLSVEELAAASAAPRFTEECLYGLTAFFNKKPAPWAK
jgi:methylglutaconyl-CoA hydratase